MGRLGWVTSVLLMVSLVLSGCGAAPTVVGSTRVPAESPAPANTRTASPAAPASRTPPTPAETLVLPTRTPADSPTPAEDTQEPVTPYALISQESIMGYLEALTAIQAYSGWRSSATEGEAEALGFVADTLNGMGTLRSWGLELERQSFHVFLSTEMWETRLVLRVAGEEIEVPADSPRGHRHDVVQALRLDSDGLLNDSERDPVDVAGAVALVRSVEEVQALTESDLGDKIVLLSSAAIAVGHYNRIGSSESAARTVDRLIDKGIAGLVIVTQPATAKFVGDGFAMEGVTAERIVPTLYVRLEDLAPAGLDSWDDLAAVESAHMVWDTDVFSPGSSGNLVARIPGVDPSEAVILGAHLDSANSPGAMDNGVNAVVLLEVARVLDAAGTQPPVDLYLVWFGSEEIGIYGSCHFVNTHQELLDRTVGALLMDGIIVSTPHELIVLDGWSHSQFGDSDLQYAAYLQGVAIAHGVGIHAVEDQQMIGSDNGVFSGFVTQAGLGWGSQQGDYAHSPYDAFEAAQGLGGLMEEIATVALGAALETGRDRPDLTVTPEPQGRAVIIASHTEVVHMTPATLIDLVRALAWEGYDVDVIPFGQAVTPELLAGAGLVLVLPTIDYPADDGIYDGAWTQEEIEALVDHVEGGGLLALVNSAHRLMLGRALESNEDWADLNPLAERFGVGFEDGAYPTGSVRLLGEHPLTDYVSSLDWIAGNGVPFSMAGGETLGQVGDWPAIGLLDHGENGGQVLVLADIGLLMTSPSGGLNLEFLRNLARYAAER